MAERNIPPKVLAVIREVADAHAISVDDLLGRERQHVVARHDAMRCVRAMEWGWRGLPPSFPRIGRWFGRDHSTVQQACKPMLIGPHISHHDDIAPRIGRGKMAA